VTRRAAGALLSLVVALGATRARAEAPQGVYTLAVSGAGALRVPTDGAEACRTARGIEVCATIVVETNTIGGLVTPDPQQRIGTLTLTGEALDGGLTLSRPLGTLSGTTQKPKAAFTFRAGGSVTEQGQPLDAAGSGKLKCAPDPALADALACRGRMVLCAFAETGAQLGCTALPVASQILLEEVPFELAFDLATDDAGVVTGTVDVVIGETSLLPRAVRGRYDARTDTVSFAASGFDAANKLTGKKVGFAEGAVHGGRIVYKIAGQKGLIEPAP